MRIYPVIEVGGQSSEAATLGTNGPSDEQGVEINKEGGKKVELRR